MTQYLAVHGCHTTIIPARDEAHARRAATTVFEAFEVDVIPAHLSITAI